MEYRKKCLVTALAAFAWGALDIALKPLGLLAPQPFPFLLYSAAGYWGAKGRGMEYGMLLGVLAGLGQCLGMVAAGLFVARGLSAVDVLSITSAGILLMSVGGGMGSMVGALLTVENSNDGKETADDARQGGGPRRSES
jgi:hypothetical protein